MTDTLTDYTTDWRVARMAFNGGFFEIPGYSVSKSGTVIGPDGKARSHLMSNGHAYCNLGPAGRRTVGSVMLASFSDEPPSPGSVVMYLDGDSSNLWLGNLTWARKVRKIKGPTYRRRVSWTRERLDAGT